MSSLLTLIERNRSLEKIRGPARKKKASRDRPKGAKRIAAGPSKGSKAPTLNEALAKRGYTTRPGSSGRRDVLDGRSGRVVLSDATASMAWAFLDGVDKPPKRKATKKKAFKRKPPKRKAPKKKAVKRKAPKKKAAKKKAAKRKAPKKKAAKKKAVKRKAPKKKAAKKKGRP